MPSAIILFSLSVFWVGNSDAYSNIENQINLQPDYLRNSNKEGSRPGDEPGDYLKVIISPEQQTVLIGGRARFTVIVLNTSNSVNLVDVNVTSPMVPDCNKTIGNLAANSNYAPYNCSSPNVQKGFVNDIFVQGSNPINSRIDTASNSARVDLLNMLVSVEPSQNNIPEPGQEISFTVGISNTGTIDLLLNGLTSSQFGNITDTNNPIIADSSCLIDPNAPIIEAGGKEFICSFTGAVTGQPGDYPVPVTAISEDSFGNVLEKTGESTVQITDVPAAISVTLKSGASSVFAPGSPVNFTVTIENTSLVDVVSIDSIADSFLGEIKDTGSCSLPQHLPPGGNYECSYAHQVSGAVGEIKSFTASASGLDDDNPPGQVSGTGQTAVEILKPPIHTIFLPNIINFLDEPNNNCSEIFPLQVNQPYYFMANDVFDLYGFNLADVGDVTVKLTNFKPQKGQLIVYEEKGDGCENAEILKNNADHSETKILTLDLLNSGQYYILVLNEGSLDFLEPYRLEIIFDELPK